MVDENEVIRLEGDGSYTHLYVQGKTPIIISKPLGEIENRLDSERFYRVHRSHTVNIDYIDKYMREDGGYLLLSNKDMVPVSRYKKEGLIQFLTGE
jgi:two-component system LytT family response regulator